MRALKSVAYVVTLPILLLALWWVVSVTSPSFFFPPLPEILAAFGDAWPGLIWSDVVPSLGRLALGYGIAVVLGVGIGVLLGLFPAVRSFCEPVFEFLRAIPPTVLIPIIMLFAGIGTEMKVAVVAIGCLWPLLLNTVEGVRSIDPVVLDTARVFRMRPTSRVRRVILPAASPQIFTGARQALALGLILTVIGEMFAANGGLGFTIVQFERHFEIPEMWSGVILLGVLGFLLAQLFGAAEKPIMRWYRGFKSTTDGQGER